MDGDPEEIWRAILSEDAARIRRAWMDLTDEEALAVLAHLRRMRDEDGWTPEQRQAAAVALQVLHDQAQ
jgi:hypothetical protein